MLAETLENERQAQVTAGLWLWSYGSVAGPKLLVFQLQTRPPLTVRRNSWPLQFRSSYKDDYNNFFLITVVINNSGKRKTHPTLSSRKTIKCQFAGSLRSLVSYNYAKVPPLRDLLPSPLFFNKYIFI